MNTAWKGELVCSVLFRAQSNRSTDRTRVISHGKNIMKMNERSSCEEGCNVKPEPYTVIAILYSSAPKKVLNDDSNYW